jgi:hypothetical protein
VTDDPTDRWPRSPEELVDYVLQLADQHDLEVPSWWRVTLLDVAYGRCTAREAVALAQLDQQLGPDTTEDDDDDGPRARP